MLFLFWTYPQMYVFNLSPTKSYLQLLSMVGTYFFVTYRPATLRLTVIHILLLTKLTKLATL